MLDFSKFIFRVALAIFILTLILVGADFFVVKSAEDKELQAVKILEEVFADRNVLLDIPFTVQAPFGNWADLRQEDGCEEASVLMAMRWAEGKDLTPEEALKEIIAISEYELEYYGEFRETSLRDTADRILHGYFGHDNFEVKYDIDAQDIKSELYKGNAVIVAVNGQILLNPFYTPPGPRDHMVVVQGYDAETQEFITNDPGTKHGERSRYAEDLLIQSLQDYPTGNHEFIPEIVKGMIVVRR
jgi:hypothetical protein